MHCIYNYIYMCTQWTDRTDWMDQKVRIYNVIANSGWLKCGPWAAVNLNAQKKARAPHITTLQQFLGSISQIAPPIGLTKKMETKNLKYPLILLHLPQYFAHWHKIGNLQKHVETCQNMFIQRTIFLSTMWFQFLLRLDLRDRIFIVLNLILDAERSSKSVSL